MCFDHETFLNPKSGTSCCDKRDTVSETMCKARTKSGKYCNARPTADGFCSIHSDPERASKLGRMSGQSRKRTETEPIVLLPPTTTSDLHKSLVQIYSRISSGQMELSRGRTLAYIASVLAKTAQLSDQESRLWAIEQMISSIKSKGKKE
jgi:hypothetical protein